MAGQILADAALTIRVLAVSGGQSQAAADDDSWIKERSQ
jgi:hypothetical protein